MQGKPGGVSFSVLLLHDCDCGLVRVSIDSGLINEQRQAKKKLDSRVKTDQEFFCHLKDGHPHSGRSAAKGLDHRWRRPPQPLTQLVEGGRGVHLGEVGQELFVQVLDVASLPEMEAF